MTDTLEKSSVRKANVDKNEPARQTYYKVNYAGKSIIPIVVTHVTTHTVTVLYSANLRLRENKFSEYCSIYLTWEEAHNDLVSALTHSVSALEKRLGYLRTELTETLLLADPGQP